MRYAWIAEHRDSWPIAAMCRTLRVSPSGFYDWRSRKPSARSLLRDRIALAVAESHAESHQVYGYRRVHTDVVEDHEIPCCDETVRNVMSALGLRGKHKERFVRTTDSDHDKPVAGNLLQRDFTTAGPNQKWLADITYIATREGWLYLATVLDAFSRRVVGWSMSERIDAALVCDALEMAVGMRCPDEGLIHHSDRGGQYASESMDKLFDLHGIAVSMSRKADPWNNAMQESFFGTLKTEWADGVYASRDEAKRELFKYIELFYNPRRRHSSLGNISPVEYERRWKNGTLTPVNQAA